MTSKNTSSNKDINITTDGEIDNNAKGLKETNPEFSSNKSGDVNLHENDDNEDINDQDDWSCYDLLITSIKLYIYTFDI